MAPTTQGELVDVVKELVAIHSRDLLPDASFPASSSMTVLDRFAKFLQEMGLDVATHTYILHYLVMNASYQSFFINMDPGFHIQWVHIIANARPSRPSPPIYNPYPPPPPSL